MYLRRISLLMLLFWWTAPSPVAHQPTRPRSDSLSFQRLTLAGRRVAVATSTSRPRTVESFSPWRYRQKSVLTDNDHRHALPLDPDPISVVERVTVNTAPIRSSHSPRAVLPLRC